MDEPFAALDEITRQKLNDDCWRCGRASASPCCFVTHSVFRIGLPLQRIVVMAASAGPGHRRCRDRRAVSRDASFRTSPDYAASCRIVSAKLLEAIAS